MIPRWSARFAMHVAVVVLLAFAPVVDAAEVPWKKERFTYLTKGQSVRDFLRQFASSQGLTVVVDPAVEGSVVGNFDLLPQSVMPLLSTQHGLIWYYDGIVLYVYPSSQAQSQMVRLNYSTVAQLRQSLIKNDIVDKRYPISFDAQANTAMVGGPKRYVELVEQTARALDQNEGSRGATDIQVFSLKYAWAADYTFTQGGREYKLPGVATVLRNLYQTNGAGARNFSASSGRRNGSMMDKLRGLGLAAPDSNSGSTGRQPTDLQEGNSTPLDGGASQNGLPQFQADGRLNAVVVRDSPDRMAFYERVIKQLDVRPSILEIEVRIIEISSDKADSFGFDWRLQTSRVDIQSGQQQLTPDTTLGRQAGAPITAGGVFATRLTDAGRELLARVNALAKTGDANILSSPRIMTLDNVEAVIENLNNFFVRVAGNLDVDLFNVSSGTSLRVTPLIVPEGDQTLIKMAIKIEDGNLTSQQVDSIPVVRRTNIGTQAFVADGESVLIAGFSQTSDSSTRAGVPGLSNVPVFGRLFRYDESSKKRVERLFLITPRVIPLPGVGR